MWGRSAAERRGGNQRTRAVCWQHPLNYASCHQRYHPAYIKPLAPLEGAQGLLGTRTSLAGSAAVRQPLRHDPFYSATGLLVAATSPERQRRFKGGGQGEVSVEAATAALAQLGVDWGTWAARSSAPPPSLPDHLPSPGRRRPRRPHRDQIGQNSPLALPNIPLMIAVLIPDRYGCPRCRFEATLPLPHSALLTLLGHTPLARQLKSCSPLHVEQGLYCASPV